MRLCDNRYKSQARNLRGHRRKSPTNDCKDDERGKLHNHGPMKMPFTGRYVIVIDNLDGDRGPTSDQV